MNIGFIFDIDGIVEEKDLKIPYLSGLHYRHFSTGDFVLNNVVDFRASVLEQNYRITGKSMCLCIDVSKSE